MIFKPLRIYILVTLACAAWPLSAQADNAGAVRGQVADHRGTGLAGVTIAISSGSPGFADRGTVTDASGTFLIPFLPIGGDYRVQASFPGLATIVLSDVVITSGSITTVNIIMQPESELRERIEVRADPQIVRLETTSTGTRFSSEFVGALPILGRNYQDVLQLAPGVSDVDGDGNPNIHGARDTDVNTLVDGISTTDPLTGKVGMQLNIESIQEVEVKTAGATAEFSGAQGGFVNVITKSGGNDFQGTFKFFWRGSTLDGDGAGIDDPTLHGGVGATGLADLEFNDFLPFVAIGGPIVKDRAWFFAALEYIQTEEPVNALSAAFVRGVEEHRDFAKLTWQASPNHRLALSANYDPQEFLNLGLNTFTRQETGFTLEQGGLLLALKAVSILSPTVALETLIADFDGDPRQRPNLGEDTNGNGVLHFDRNENGFLEARERDPGEDYDRDGAYDIFEDLVVRNRRFDLGEGDLDRDGRLTGVLACEGDLREDIDCDGRLDAINEDLNHNGVFDQNEIDLDHDGFLDLGNEDRNGDGLLSDTPFPTDSYPYGRLSPRAPDRDYSIDLVRGIIDGPYYDEYSDTRGRLTLRQDLSVFVPDSRGSHDLKLGYILEQEDFDRRTVAHDISAPNDTGAPNCSRNRCLSIPGPHTITMLLPTERTIDSEASSRNTGLYVQDTYKPRPNLAIGIGVRFDREIADSSGYNQFEPGTERALFNRLNALTGAETGLDRFFEGNGDGVISRGVASDPIFSGAAEIDQAVAFIVGPLKTLAPTRLTRHRSSVSFLSPDLKDLLESIGDEGGLNEQALADLGVSAQQPEHFTLTNNNLSPRLSVSWDPWQDGRTKLFGTWGRYYDKLFLSTIVGEQGPDRVQRYYSIDHTGLTLSQPNPRNRAIATPNHQIGGVISQSPPSTTQIDRGLRTPYSDEITLGFEREIAPEVALSVRFIDRRFRDQLQDVDINHVIRFEPETGEIADRIGELVVDKRLAVNVPDGRPDLYIHNFFFNQVLRVGNSNEARYKAIELEVRKRLSRRWELQNSYSYSRAVGSAEDFQSRLGNDPSTLESEFGYLDFDQRHAVKLNAMTYLPRDWQLGFTASWGSGLPYSVVSRFFALDDTRFQQFRTRFGFTEQERFQSRQRNSERNASVFDLNLQIKKSLVIGRASAALFLEVFNLLNTDDLRIFTFEPNRGFDESEAGCMSFCGESQEGLDPEGLAGVSSTNQLDGERRFGRRFQLGIQFDF